VRMLADSTAEVFMDRDELIKSAKAAIGEGQPDDYVLAPRNHADSLTPKAPVLASILRRSEFSAVVGQYEHKDSEAGQAQRVFRQTANRANWAVFVTVCLSAALLIAGPLTSGAVSKSVLVGLGSCGIVSGALGAMWLFRIREGKLLEKWMTARAGAETARLSYFEKVTGVRDVDEGSAIPLPLLQLEYFRRYQLDIERAYYRNRGREHGIAAAKMLTISAFSVALGSLATGLAGFLGGAISSGWVSIAGLGTIATALSAFASGKEAVGQDRRNEERYGRTLEALESLAGRLDQVRNSAAEGAREPLQQFVAAVHEQVSLEHRQWLGAAENTQASLAKLEEALTSARTKLAKPENPNASGIAPKEQTRGRLPVQCDSRDGPT
jgi:hypothetical protein